MLWHVLCSKIIKLNIIKFLNCYKFQENADCFYLTRRLKELDLHIERGLSKSCIQYKILTHDDYFKFDKARKSCV